jgi:hypothetical protein
LSDRIGSARPGSELAPCTILKTLYTSLAFVSSSIYPIGRSMHQGCNHHESYDYGYISSSSFTTPFLEDNNSVKNKKKKKNCLADVTPGVLSWDFYPASDGLRHLIGAGISEP